MKAVGYAKPLPLAEQDSLLDLDLPKPAPGPRDLLVAVKAISVNPVDVKVRASRVPPEGGPTKGHVVLGWDAVGTVEAVGSEVSLFAPGDQIFYAGDLTRPGTNAEFHVVDERLVGHAPKTLSAAQAAALPLTGLTAWELLFDRLGIVPGKRPSGALLIIGGAGGVGSILIQLARRLTGLTVIATASRPETEAWCRALGAEHVIDHHKGLAEELARIGIPEVEYVAGLTATSQHLPAIPAILKPQGHFALIDDPQTLDIVPFKRKSIAVHWELMFTRSLYQTEDMTAQHRILTEIAELADAGMLRTTLDQVVGKIDAAGLKRAHALVESGKAKGKVVLEGFR